MWEIFLHFFLFLYLAMILVDYFISFYRFSENINTSYVRQISCLGLFFFLLFFEFLEDSCGLC